MLAASVFFIGPRSLHGTTASGSDDPVCDRVEAGSHGDADHGVVEQQEHGRGGEYRDADESELCPTLRRRTGETRLATRRRRALPSLAELHCGTRVKNAAGVDPTAELHERGDRNDRDDDGGKWLPPCSCAHRDAVGHRERRRGGEERHGLRPRRGRAPDRGEGDEVAGDEYDADRARNTLRVLRSRRQCAECAEDGGVEGVAEYEPYDDPREDRPADCGNIGGVGHAHGDERDQSGEADLREPEEPDAGDLAGEQAACRHASEEDFDDTARLLFHDPGEHHGAVGRDAHEQQDGHDECGRLVVGSATGDPTQFDVRDPDRSHDCEHFVGADAGGRGPLADRDQLNGTRQDRTQLFVGLAPPLQPLSVDDENVDIAVADGLLPGGQGLVAVHARE